MSAAHSLTPTDLFLSVLDKVKRSGRGWTACCPAHDDRSPSLSVSSGDDGRVLVHCWAGCETKVVVEAAGLSLRDLFPEGMSLDSRQQYQIKSLESARDHARLLLEIASNSADDLSEDDLLVAAKARQDLPRIEASLDELKPVVSRLAVVSLDDVMSAELEPVRFVIAPWFPRRHLTLFGGHGGVGKSAFCLAAAAHVACGRPFAGLEVERASVLFVSLEDEPSIVRLRLRRVIEAYGLPDADVLANMRLLDGTQYFSALMTDGGSAGASPIFTPAFRELVEHASGAGLIVIDNASDAFDANENARREVRAFVRGLATLGRQHDAAVVLLAHIDKAAARGGAQGNSYSGSTAWHNSARSRLAMVVQDERITVTHEKCNLSGCAEPITVEFKSGIPMPSGAAVGVDGVTQAMFDQAAILRVMASAHEAGIVVPAAMSGPNTALHVLESFAEYCPELKRGKAGRLRAKQAITALRRDGRLAAESYKTASRNIREQLVLTQKAAASVDDG